MTMGESDAFLDSKAHPERGRLVRFAEPKFVLDRDSNPHPELLAAMLKARAEMKAQKLGTTEAHYRTGIWQGFVQATAAATGCPREEIISWVRHHEREGRRDLPDREHQ